MRRVIVSALVLAATAGLLVVPASADPPAPSAVILAFDFSDNSAPASASNGTFNIITDVLPEHTGGVVREIATPPDSANLPNLVCGYQPVQQSQVECAFNFTVSGVWSIRSEYAVDTKSTVSATATTKIRVGN